MTGRRAARRRRVPGQALVPLALVGATAPAADAQSAPQSGARREVAAELFAGTAWSLPTPLTVRLPEARPTALRARYSTRPLADAPYDAYRVSYGTPTRAVEAELVVRRRERARAERGPARAGRAGGAPQVVRW